MSSLARTSSDRNQVRSPNIKFRVFSRNNGECKHEFCIRLKDITWDSFLKNLFGSHTFEENQLPTIVLLGDKHKIVLRHTNIKQLIRDALEESFKGFSVNLLIPDFENYFSPTTNANGQNAPNKDEIERKKAEINDFIAIFSKRISLPAMDRFIQNTPHVRFIHEDRDESKLVEMPARENTTQLGELHVKRLNDGDLLKLLKDGANLVLQTSDNKMVSMKFYNDQLPTFNETQCKYRNLNMAYECNDLKIPVLIDDEIKFLFNQDAEFIQNMKTSGLDKFHREHISKLKLLQETMRKIKTDKEASPDPITPSTSGVTISTAAAPDASTPPVISSMSRAAVNVAVPDASFPLASESSSSEQALADLCPRVFRRPHRSAQKRTKRCLAAAALANAAVYSSTALANGGVSSVDAPAGIHPPYVVCRENLLKAFQDLSLASSPPRLSNLAAFCHSGSNIAQPSVKAGTNKNVGVDARQEITPDPPAWFGEVLDKFKNEVLHDVKNLVKDVLDTSFPTPLASDVKTVRVQNQDDDQYHYKALDGSPSSSGGKHKHYEKHHHGSGSSKRKSGSLCSKRGAGVLGGAENKTTAPYSASEKILEISGGLFVYSKSGFKVRMPRNASLTIQINIGKLAKCRNSLDDTDLRVQSVSNSIECCVKRATPASSACKSAPANKDLSVYYDVRIKSKDKSGKFRLYFNVISGGRIVGHSFKIDVRVKKEFTLPFGNSEGTLNYESEAFPIPIVENMMQAASSSGTNFVESQKSSVQNFQEEISTVAAAAAAAELADEGIGGNQEDFFSPTSDSEYSDMSDSKPDMLLKDEGIDTCYRSVVEPVTTAELECEHPDFDSGSDTDSSISFLMDENEARDELNDSLDVVQLPSCFIPNIECTDDVLPVRIKRKSSAVNKRAVSEKNETELPPQPQNIKPSAFDTSTLTPVAVAAASAPSSSAATAAKRTTPSPTPAVTISDDEEDEDVEFLNESIKSAAADHAYHRSLYPNLQGLKECIRPTTSNDAATNAEPSGPSPSPKTPASTPESPKQQPAPEPYPHILPEKLFEMWKNASPIPRQMQNTVSSVLNSVSNEINNAASVARTAAVNAAAAAANIVPNVPMPPTPSAPSPSPSTVKPENFNSSILNEIHKSTAAARAAAASAAAAAANIGLGPMPMPMQSPPSASPFWTNGPEHHYVNNAATCAQLAANSTPSMPKDENRSSHSQPPEEKRQKNVAFSFEACSAPSQPQPGFTFGSQQQQQPPQSGQSGNGEHIHSMYKNLSEQMQADLITLHDMGFTDDPYMIYLLEQFPNDLSKVIESLINYSTY